MGFSIGVEHSLHCQDLHLYPERETPTHIKHNLIATIATITSALMQ